MPAVVDPRALRASATVPDARIDKSKKRLHPAPSTPTSTPIATPWISPDAYVCYSTPDSPQAMRAFYGMAPGEVTRLFSPDDSATADVNRTGATPIGIRLSNKHTAAAALVGIRPGVLRLGIQEAAS